MSIVTRFGSPVEIIGRHHDYEETGWVNVRFADDHDPCERSMLISDLRADGGVVEINAAAMAAPIAKKQ